MLENMKVELAWNITRGHLRMARNDRQAFLLGNWAEDARCGGEIARAVDTRARKEW